jgi:hypothetical protein
MPLNESPGFWNQAQTVTSVLVNVSVLAAAIAAAIKARILQLLARRYRSELCCRHHVLADRRIVFVVEYAVQNTGERPIALSQVRLTLHPPVREQALLLHDPNAVLAQRALVPGPATRGLFLVEAGERSIVTLRRELPELPEITFVPCQLSWPDRRAAAPFIGMYVARDSTLSPKSAASQATVGKRGT